MRGHRQQEPHDSHFVFPICKGEDRSIDVSLPSLSTGFVQPHLARNTSAMPTAASIGRRAGKVRDSDFRIDNKPSGALPNLQPSILVPGNMPYP